MVRKIFKDWTTFEKLFLIFGTVLALVLTPVFRGTIFDLFYTLLYFWTALLLAKGKWVCYVIGIVSTFFYAYVSYQNGYYGEIMISMFLTLPLTIVGLLDWIRHQDKTKTVVVKNISKRELLIVLGSQIILGWGYYYLLKMFGTQNLVVSTLSIVASLVATYLTARRSEHGFVGFIINDVILIMLWGMPVISGDFALIPVVLCPVLLLVNDIYGVYNWKRIKGRQKGIK